MTTLVTGAFGCIGSWVVRGLLADGERPVALDLGDDPWRLRMIAGDDVTSRVTLVRGDVTDREAIAHVVREHGVRRIVHLAAWQVPLCRQDPARGALINVVGTTNVFEVARTSGGQVERVVYASSAAVFGPPTLYPPGAAARRRAAPPRPRTTACTRWPTRPSRAFTGKSTASAPPASGRNRCTVPAATSA